MSQFFASGSQSIIWGGLGLNDKSVTVGCKIWGQSWYPAEDQWWPGGGGGWRRVLWSSPAGSRPPQPSEVSQGPNGSCTHFTSVAGLSSPVLRRRRFLRPCLFLPRLQGPLASSLALRALCWVPFCPQGSPTQLLFRGSCLFQLWSEATQVPSHPASQSFWLRCPS